MDEEEKELDEFYMVVGTDRPKSITEQIAEFNEKNPDDAEKQAEFAREAWSKWRAKILRTIAIDELADEIENVRNESIIYELNVWTPTTKM